MRAARKPDFEFDDRKTYSYLHLRRTVGIIGMTLPFVVMIGHWIFKNDLVFESSISHYYYTDMRNVFVGAMCAVGLFMFFYIGDNKKHNRTGDAAGYGALGVALIPTSAEGPDITGWVHFAFALLFFSALVIFCLRLFPTDKGNYPGSKEWRRNLSYKICGFGMISCIVFIGINMGLKSILTDAENPLINVPVTYICETIALIFFGFSWILKGEMMWRDVEIQAAV